MWTYQGPPRMERTCGGGGGNTGQSFYDQPVAPCFEAAGVPPVELQFQLQSSMGTTAAAAAGAAMAAEAAVAAMAEASSAARGRTGSKKKSRSSEPWLESCEKGFTSVALQRGGLKDEIEAERRRLREVLLDEMRREAAGTTRPGYGREDDSDDDDGMDSSCNSSSCTIDTCTTSSISSASTRTSGRASPPGISAGLEQGPRAQARRLPRRGGIGPRTSRLSSLSSSREGRGTGKKSDERTSNDAVGAQTKK
ncbi:unnamed protein product, partial [Scytosiphon promiscuus]